MCYVSREAHLSRFCRRHTVLQKVCGYSPDEVIALKAEDAVW
jgi:hypothetical protein